MGLFNEINIYSIGGPVHQMIHLGGVHITTNTSKTVDRATVKNEAESPATNKFRPSSRTKVCLLQAKCLHYSNPHCTSTSSSERDRDRDRGP